MKIEQPTGKLAQGFMLVLLLEYAAYLTWFLLGSAGGQVSWSLLLRILAVWIGIRAMVTAANFAQTWLARSPRAPEHRIGPLATIRLLLHETWAALLTYPGYFALEGRLVPNAPPPELPHRGPPIVLVPGFACNRGYFGRFRRFLAEQGYGNVWAVSLEPVFGDIEDNARQLSEFVDLVRQRTGSEKLILIGHSMGGLTIRSYLHQLDGTDKVDRVISLGTPYQGTVIAKGVNGLGRCLQQMTIGNDWLAALNRCEGKPAPVPVTAIWSPHDSIVAPQLSATVSPTYGRSVALPGVGHVDMIISRPVMNATLEALQR